MQQKPKAQEVINDDKCLRETEQNEDGEGAVFSPWKVTGELIESPFSGMIDSGHRSNQMCVHTTNKQ